MANYIPEKHTVVKRKESDLENPLAFLVPWTDDKSYQNRLNTAMEWGTQRKYIPEKRSYGQRIEPDVETYKNVPLDGFRVLTNISRISTSNVVWRVADPRGFQLEIYSDNMAYIIANCTIHEGLIVDKLQWVRDGAQNYLLPVDSELHKEYITHTNAVKKDLKLSELVVGDVVTHTVEQSDYLYLGRISSVNHAIEKINIHQTRADIIDVDYRHRFMKLNSKYSFDLLHECASSWKGIVKKEHQEMSEEEALQKFVDIRKPMYAQHGKVKIKDFKLSLEKTSNKSLIGNENVVLVLKNMRHYRAILASPWMRDKMRAREIYKMDLENNEAQMGRSYSIVSEKDLNISHRGLRNYYSDITFEWLNEEVDKGNVSVLCLTINDKKYTGQ